MAINYPQCNWTFSNIYLAILAKVNITENMLVEALGPCEDHFDFLSDTFVTSLIVIYCIVMIVGFFGNLWVIWIISTTPKLHIPVNMLLLSLCISNLILTLTSPWTLVYNISYDYTLGEGLCRAIPPIQGMAVMSGIYALVLIAVERHQVTVYPRNKQIFKKRIQLILVIACLWIISFCFQIPQIIVLRDTPHSVSNEVEANSIWYHFTIRYCDESWDLWQSRAYSISILVFMYAVPLILLTLLYSKIGYFIFIRQPIGNVVSSTAAARAQTQRRRMLLMLVLLVAAFALFWGPYFIVMVVCLDSYCSSELTPYLQWLGHVNVALDPILYAVLHVRIRNAFVNKFKQNKRYFQNLKWSGTYFNNRNAIRRKHAADTTFVNEQYKSTSNMNKAQMHGQNMPIVSITLSEPSENGLTSHGTVSVDDRVLTTAPNKRYSLKKISVVTLLTELPGMTGIDSETENSFSC